MSDNKIRILFLLSRFLDGGIDMVLIDYLRHLSCDPAYKLTLAIGVSMNELEVFAKDVPPQVSVVHFVNADWLTKWRRRKIVNSHLPLAAKVYDELCLSPLRRIIISRELRKLTDKHDVVIDFDCCFYSYLKKIDVHKIAWFHFSFDQSLRQNHRRTQRIGHALEAYNKVICISEAMKAEGERLFPALKDKLCVIYNAKDYRRILEKTHEEVQDPRIHESYMIAVERLEESQKDLTTLLKAYRILLDKYHHQEKLYLLGKGNSENNLRKLVEQLGISDKVVFLGFHSNPFPWILHSQLLVHSAKFEGLPTILIEGLMLDKLMVASDCPTGPREILDEGRAGLLFPVGDANTLAESIHTILTDKAVQDSLLERVSCHRQKFLFSYTESLFRQIINEL